MALYEATFVARIPQQTDSPQFVELGQLKHTSISWTQDLTGDRVDVAVKIPSLTDEIKDRLLELDRTPNELWLHRDGSRVFCGPITSYSVQKQTITMYAPGVADYLRAMVWSDAYSATDGDQALIVRDLIDQYQAFDYGNFGIDTTGLTATGVTRDLNLLATEPRALDSIFTEMGNRDNGFDLAVDYEDRRIVMHHPRRGTDLSDIRILDRRNLTDAQLRISVAPGVFAPRIVATSSSPTGGALTSTAVDTTAEARFGRMMLAASFSNIERQATLDDHASKLVGTMASPAFVVAPTLVPVADLDVGDIGPGDTVTYDFDLGLGAQSFARRIKTVNVTIRKAKERMGVTFL